jgi:isochorismate hydrolase
MKPALIVIDMQNDFIKVFANNCARARTYKTKVVNLNQLKMLRKYEKGRTHKKG